MRSRGRRRPTTRSGQPPPEARVRSTRHAHPSAESGAAGAHRAEGLGCSPHRGQHSHDKHEVGDVGRHQRRGCPLRDQPGDQRPEAEPEGQRDRPASGTRLVRSATVERRHRKFLHPGRAGSEDHAAGCTGHEAPREQQRQVVTASHQQHSCPERHDDGRTHQPSAPPAVGRRTTEQQSHHQAHGVDAEQAVVHGRGDSPVLAVGDEQRDELVGAPGDREDAACGTPPVTDRPRGRHRFPLRRLSMMH